MQTVSTTTAIEPTTRSGHRHLWLVLGSIVSVQFGAGFARRLFDDVGPPAVVMLRQGGAALVLLAISRPNLRGRPAGEWRVILGLGIVLAGMNLTFYESVARLPLGVAVTIELLGPLGLAVALVRRAAEFWWTALALAGVVLLGEGGSSLDPLGVAFALAAAAGWAGYILLNRAAGRTASGVGVLALSMATASLAVAPLGLATAGTSLVSGRVLLLGGLVALLSGLVPFSFEFVALRHVPARVFGLLMSLSPVAATLSGVLLLHEHLDALQWAAMAMVMVASAATVAGRRSPRG